MEIMRTGLVSTLAVILTVGLLFVKDALKRYSNI